MPHLNQLKHQIDKDTHRTLGQKQIKHKFPWLILEICTHIRRPLIGLITNHESRNKNHEKNYKGNLSLKINNNKTETNKQE